MRTEKNEALISEIKETEKLAREKLTHSTAMEVARLDLVAIKKMALQDAYAAVAMRLNEEIRLALGGLGHLQEDDATNAAALQQYQDTEYQIRKNITQVMGSLH